MGTMFPWLSGLSSSDDRAASLDGQILSGGCAQSRPEGITKSSALQNASIADLSTPAIDLLSALGPPTSSQMGLGEGF